MIKTDPRNGEQLMLTVERESDKMPPPYERCCICGTPTPYWYLPKDVALCQECAKITVYENIPEKDQWLKDGCI